jgi:hypothetical protein
MHPERCWEFPTVNQAGWLWASATATAHNGDGSFQLIDRWFPALGHVGFTIVRSIGPGNITPQ